MNIFTKLMTSVTLGVLTALGLPLTQNAAAADGPLADSAAPVTHQTGLDEFQILFQRNIFDPNRGTAAPKEETVVKPPLHIETFSFRGAGNKLGKGFDAFFTGDGAPASGRLDVNDSINGFTVREITLSEVRLTDAGHNVVILKAQTGLRRQDGGPWTKIFTPVSYRVSPQARQGDDSGGMTIAPDGVTESPAPIDPALLARTQAPRAPEN